MFQPVARDDGVLTDGRRGGLAPVAETTADRSARDVGVSGRTDPAGHRRDVASVEVDEHGAVPDVRFASIVTAATETSYRYSATPLRRGHPVPLRRGHPAPIRRGHQETDPTALLPSGSRTRRVGASDPRARTSPRTGTCVHGQRPARPTSHPDPCQNTHDSTDEQY